MYAEASQRIDVVGVVGSGFSSLETSKSGSSAVRAHDEYVMKRRGQKRSAAIDR